MNKSPTKPWEPNISYKLKIQDVEAQPTPAEAYRHKLATTGKEMRVLQRLEWRWEKRLEKWTRAATIVKAGYRGMLGRRYFRSIREELEVGKEQRTAKASAIAAIRENRKEDAIRIASSVRKMNGELYLILAKVYYTLHRFEECEKAGRAAFDFPRVESDARYMVSCSLVQQKQYPEAYEELTRLMVLCGDRDDACKLKSFLSTKLEPPKHHEGILTMTTLINKQYDDLNLILQRACIYCGIQDWIRATEDLNYVLYFQPELHHVRALRGRVFCARRMWKEAEEDFDTVLQYEPDNAGALYGLSEIRKPINELPMIDEALIDG